ncbi:prepilin peptidase [Streptomyces sp. NPDC017936]|uniref:prepilin peptidase n=1 Tax=Streptomyces sp. NPDC017936 TaxID=3365016 RepID=UPI00379B52D5
MSRIAAIDAALVDPALIDAAPIGVAVVWGAVAGASLPRAVHRFSVPLPPEEEGPPPGWHRACPRGHPLRGWLGPARCPDCTGTVTRYGPRVPLLATVTALVCALLAAATGPRPELAVWLLLAPVGVLLAAVDLRVRRLPDPLTLPLAAAALALLGVAALLPEHAGDWTTALLGSLALSAGYLVLHLLNPGGMGFGDVKLALGAGAVLGWYGWATVMLGTFAGFLLGALYGGALLVTGRAGRRTAVPFGPFLVTGTYLGLLIGAYAA